jgi:NADP-dependent 3-hydroxy acid dehydrogenase YdfG
MASAKIALVTGAGTGVGRAVAIALAKAGYNLVLAGRRKEMLDKVAGEINALGAQALAVPTDVSKRESIVSLFTTVKSTFGRLDVLFNNAGIGAPAVPLEDLPFETWQNVVATNLTGMFLCTQEAIKIMKSLTKSTSLDCRQYDICCGQVDIGNAATPLTERMVQGEGVLQPDGRKMIEPRMEADHVGNAVVYMAGLPLDTNVLFMTVMANKMPFVGRG